VALSVHHCWVWTTNGATVWLACAHCSTAIYSIDPWPLDEFGERGVERSQAAHTEGCDSEMCPPRRRA